MLAFFILFLILSAGGVLCAAFSRHRYEEAVPLTSMGIVLVLFVFGICGFLKAGVYAVCLVSAVCYASAAVRLIRTRDWAGFFTRLLTPGAVIYALLFACLFVWDYNRLVYHWDEFSHWTDVVKMMTLHDVLSTSPISHSMFQSYVPGMALFQYFVQKIAQLFQPGAAYQEWLCSYAYHVMSVSVFMPLLSRFRFRRFISALLLTLAVYLVPAIYYDFLKSTLSEPYLGILAGSGFALLYARKTKDGLVWAQLCLIVAMLVLAKDVGMLLAVCLGAGMIAEQLFFAKGAKRSVYIWRAALVILSIALPKILWNISVHANAAHVSFEPRSASSYLKLLTGAGDAHSAQVLTNYMRALFTWTQGITLFSVNIKLTYPVLFVILLSLLFALHAAFGHKEPEEGRRRKMVLMMIILQTCIYAGGMGFVYALKFSASEALRLASFHRYLNVPFLALGMMAVLLAAEYMQSVPERWYMLWAIVLSMVMSLGSAETVYDYVTRASISPSIEEREPYARMVEKLGALSTEQRAYVVAQGREGYEYLILSYCLRPARAGGTASFAADGWLEGMQMESSVKSAADWREELKGYDYVLCYMLDSSFREDYGELFANPEDIADQTVFRVDHEAEQLVLCE